MVTLKCSHICTVSEGFTTGRMGAVQSIAELLSGSGASLIADLSWFERILVEARCGL